MSDVVPVRANGQGEDHRLPVTVLTGFLGAGKTTCLNAFLELPQAAGTAVVVNEFGAIDVDGAVLAGEANGTNLLSLPNGCVCCEVQEDLTAAIVSIADRGEARRCIVETTGLAEPGAILRGLHHDARLRRVARAELVLTVVAADRAAEQITRFPETARQIALADRLLLSKTDVARPADRARAEAVIAELNPLAECLDHPDPAIAFSRPPVYSRSVPQAVHAHSHGLATFTVALPAPLDPDRFRDTLSFLIMRHAENLLRAKGVVRFAGVPNAQLIDIVHDVYAARTTQANAQPGIVFIGQGLPEAEIRSELEACMKTYAPVRWHLDNDSKGRPE